MLLFMQKEVSFQGKGRTRRNARMGIVLAHEQHGQIAHFIFYYSSICPCLWFGIHFKQFDRSEQPFRHEFYMDGRRFDINHGISHLPLLLYTIGYVEGIQGHEKRKEADSEDRKSRMLR